MSTLDQMQGFVAVVEQGSFTAAALVFDISPTAMSKKIAALESSLKARLLIRNPRAVALTDIGKKYYTQCKRVLYEYKLSNMLVESKTSQCFGTLDIVCGREIAQQLVYPTMANFLEQYPDIVTNVTLKRNLTGALCQGFDVVIAKKLSDSFGEWCYCNQDELCLYYPNVKPTPMKIKIYVDYLVRQNEGG